MRLLIVDGSNLLFQMFFGMPSRIVNKDGRAIHGTLGFVGALLKILRRVKPTHAVVLFDSETENPRTALDEGYKANREDYSKLPPEDNPFSCLSDIYRALECLKLPYAEASGCEADDLICGYVNTYGADNEIIISSHDSDFFQLISENTRVLRYRGDKTLICDREYVLEKLGISPIQYADFKAMTGDTADNIRGAEKIGTKTAAALLREFGSLENIILSKESIKRPCIRASITENAERLMLNYKLIKLTGSVRLPYHLSTLSYTDSGMTTRQVLAQIGIY